jgi:glutamyl-tRNA synthetase
MIRVRFSAVPAGYLYIRGARIALANALFALRHRGTFLLRLDDRDSGHCRPSFVDALIHDLHWLGLEWQETLRQSERLPRYEAAAERLKAAGRLYPCFETQEELRYKQEQRRRQGKPTVYDRGMLNLTPEQRAAAEANGKRPHWRFRLSDRTVSWEDLAAGPREAKLPSVSDPVVISSDGSLSSAFASVVDDIDTGITHVIEGEENAAQAGIEIDLFTALGAEIPRFAHIPTLTEDPGRRSGRRIDVLTVRSLRADGVEAVALAACLAGDEAASVMSFTELAATFELPRPDAPHRFDTGRLLRLNRQVLGAASFASVAERLPPGATEAFWLAIRGNIDLLNEARGWWDVVAGTIVPPVMSNERAFLHIARDMLPDEPWDQEVLDRWLAQLAEATGRHGPALLAPLRLALTGEETGPDLGLMLPLIGRARALNRLAIAVA